MEDNEFPIPNTYEDPEEIEEVNSNILFLRCGSCQSYKMQFLNYQIKQNGFILNLVCEGCGLAQGILLEPNNLQQKEQQIKSPGYFG